MMPPRPKIPTPPAPVPPKNSAEVRTASFKDRVAAFETKFQESLDSVTKTMQEQGQRNDDRHNELKEMVNKQMADQTKIIELMSEKHALEKKQMEETTQAQLKQMQQKCALEIKQMEEASKAKLTATEFRIFKEHTGAAMQKEQQLQSFTKANADFAKENTALARNLKDEQEKLKESERQNRVLRGKLEDRCASSQLSGCDMTNPDSASLQLDPLAFLPHRTQESQSLAQHKDIIIANLKAGHEKRQMLSLYIGDRKNHKPLSDNL